MASKARAWQGRRTAFALAALSIVGLAASCGLSTSGIPGNGPPPCGADADCFGDDLCKVGSCGDDGVCKFTPRPDGEPPAQIPGDCKLVTCKGGDMIAAADPTDNDDGNVCTKDDCDGDAPSHQALDDVQCGANGVCEKGQCVISCAEAGDPCEETPANPCTEDSCDVGAGVCVHVPLHGQVLDTGDEHDCKQLVCVRDQAQTVPHDTEVPDDSDPCTKDSCQAGVIHNDGDPSLEGMECGAADGVCNATGSCVGCNSPGDCPGMDNECQHRTCEREICGNFNEPDGTLVSGQTGGDCSKVVCDGGGATKSVTDGGDVPGDDLNPCTSESCSGNVPVHPPVGIGTSCNVSGGKVCNATGQCVQCNDPVDCGDPGLCKTATCSANLCGFPNVPDNNDPNGQCNDDGAASCDNDGKCNGSGACRKYAGGTVCSPPVCMNGTATAQGTCDGNGTCNAGGTTPCGVYACGNPTCKTSCNNSGDCAPPNVCNTSTHVCGQSDGTGCGSSGVCASGVCSDGVCCNVNCSGPCQECNLGGFVGTCKLVAVCQQGGCPGGSACNGSSTQNCYKLDGQNCGGSSECLGGNCNGSNHCSGDSC